MTIPISSLSTTRYETPTLYTAPYHDLNRGDFVEIVQKQLDSLKNLLTSRYKQSAFYLFPMGLYECACRATHFFDRLRNDRRTTLETLIVERLSSKDKTTELHLLSIGSGGLLAEFIVLERLVCAGFTDIHLDCVEPLKIEQELVDNIHTFFQQCPAIKLSVRSFSDIQELLSQENQPYDAMWAFDFEALYTNSHHERYEGTMTLGLAWKQRLPASGFMVLGSGSRDTLLTTDMEMHILSPDPYWLGQFLSAVYTMLKEREISSFSIALSHPMRADHYCLWATYLAALKTQRVYQSISLTLYMQPQSTFQNTPHSSFTKMIHTLFSPEVTEKLHLTTTQSAEDTKTYDIFFLSSTDRAKRKALPAGKVGHAIDYVLDTWN